jgi:hypothetical protein
MNPRQLGCLLIVAGFVALGAKLWSDFGPELDVSAAVHETPKEPEVAQATAPDPVEPLMSQGPAATPAVAEPESVPTARFIVYLDDPECATRVELAAKAGFETDLLESSEQPPPAELEATRGFTPADAAKLRKAAYAYLIFVPARAGALDTVQRAQKLAGAVAEACGGYVKDLDLGFVFSAAAWKTVVVDSWLGDGSGALPRVTNHFSTLREKTLLGTRVYTQGLSRFGVPEIELAVGPTEPPSASRLLDLAAQFEVERGGLEPDTLLEIEGVDHHEAREQYERMASPGAQLSARVKVSHVEGADQPRVRLELNDEQLRAANEALFGSAKARVVAAKTLAPKVSAKLSKEVLPRFKKGLAAGEALFVLGPDGWLRVDRLTGTRLSGTDAADPVGRRLPLEVEAKRVLDYSFLRDDGTWEGNTTGIELGER